MQSAPCWRACIYSVAIYPLLAGHLSFLRGCAGGRADEGEPWDEGGGRTRVREKERGRKRATKHKKVVWHETAVDSFARAERDEGDGILEMNLTITPKSKRGKHTYTSRPCLLRGITSTL